MAQPSEIITNLSYFLSVVAMTGVLIWGLKHVSRELSRVVDPANQRTFMAEVLSEKRTLGASAPPAGTSEPPSFSRVAGALGAVGIAATFVGIGYWALHGLYFGGSLNKISDLSTYFLAGSALFIPYAFNTISSVFK